MRLNQRLCLLFLPLVVISLILISVLILDKGSQIISIHSSNELNAIADLKITAINVYFTQLKTNVEVMQDYYNIKINLPIMIRFSNNTNSPEYLASEKMLDGQLKKWLQSQNDIIDIMLLSPEGKIVYAANDLHKKTDIGNNLDTLDKLAFEKGKTGVYFSDIYKADNKEFGYDFGMLVLAPVYDFNNTFIGVVATEMNMKNIYGFIQDTTGLGETGETLIAKNFDGELIILNPLRHQPDSALNIKIKLGSPNGLPLQQAVLSGNGSGDSIDYRGKSVLAEWRYIEPLDWAFVAKIDHEELYRPINELKTTTITFGAIIVILSILFVFLAAKTISQPIERLTQLVNDMSIGNFDSEMDPRLKLRTDEIGDLAISFDRVLISLKLAMKKIGTKKEGSTNSISKQNKIDDAFKG